MSVPLGEPAATTADAQPTGAPDGVEPTGSQRFAGPGSRRATYAVLVVIGIELGLIGAFLSLQVLHVFGAGVPLGPVIGVAANVVAGLWAVRITGNRTAPVAPAVGWIATVLLLSTSRGEGDLVITNSGKGVAFLFLGALAWPLAAAGGRRLAGPQPAWRAKTTTLSR